MPPGPTEIVYVSVEPESVPTRNPFISTVPVDSPMSTGPLTFVASVCVSVHVIRTGSCCTVRLPIHVPVRLVDCDGVEGVDLSVQAMSVASSRATAIVRALRMLGIPFILPNLYRDTLSVEEAE